MKSKSPFKPRNQFKTIYGALNSMLRQLRHMPSRYLPAILSLSSYVMT
ncbi:MAG TPA: hypothetical protein PKI15_08075 [Candidatus Cloacimonadota bacterium]|nr:hypothetical protein [Candidatus Cloacimonadota bacterium]